MNGIRYYSSDPENADNFMEWDGVSGIERIGPSIGGGVISSHYPNLIAGCSSSQPTTSGYIGKKRKCLSSSPLPKKISRNIWNEKQQQEEFVLVNKTNLQINHEVASEFSTTTPVSQLTLVELRDISNQVTSDNKSSLLVNGGIETPKVTFQLMSSIVLVFRASPGHSTNIGTLI
ncbi:hypothetical protein AVEN_274191-1 [Araneus ventricosus]|uniref:Uncharacterized protein n=1 Tax=Araneus ventricosus TaxID=182803 RepID=A0A4Y2R4F4_ARAVE|nr:hypothetical protein AVEN_274191-1 [Araneus ventricosus]